MYWHIGERINREVLGNERAEYGKQIVAQVARQLQEEFGTKGFDVKSIRRMMQFASRIPDFQIVAQLATQLSWSHFMEVIPLKDDLQREFYLTLAASEKWGRNQLRKEIDGMLYERTAIATKPDELIKQELTELRENNVLTPDLVFKSPYFLEFTGLKGMYSEKSLEDSLVAHLEQFILELGNGFETRQVQGTVQRPDGVVSAMARSQRDGGWRGAAPRPVALHRRWRRADRAAATRQVGYQSGAVYDRTPFQRTAATPDTQRPGGRPPALGESLRRLTAE